MAYQPGDPTSAIIDGWISRWGASLIIAVAGIAIASIGLYAMGIFKRLKP